MASRTKRVLIYRLGSLGDTIVALPAYHLVERAFPDAERRLLTNFPVSGKAAAAAAILGDSGLVDGYISYPVSTRNPLELLALWWKIVRWNPQVLIYLGPVRGLKAAKRDSLFFKLCGIFRQIGVPQSAEEQIPQWNPSRTLVQAEAVRLADSLKQLGDGSVLNPNSWNLRLTEQERARAAEVLQPIEQRPRLCISLGTKVPANHWGMENWIALMRGLGASYPAYALVLFGAKDEAAACDQLTEAWRSGAGPQAITVNLCGRLTPRESAACMESAKVYIGHDSGPLHLAAAVGVPCVGIFSARNHPGLWFPIGDQHRILYRRVECMGCFLETCTVQNMKCIRSITVDQVFTAVQQTLSQSGAASFSPRVN